VQKGHRIDGASLRYIKGCCCEGRKKKKKKTDRLFLVLYTRERIIGIHRSENWGGHEMVERKTLALDAQEANIIGDEME
jgi:hypothetical protein